MWSKPDPKPSLFQYDSVLYTVYLISAAIVLEFIGLAGTPMMSQIKVFLPPPPNSSQTDATPESCVETATLVLSESRVTFVLTWHQHSRRGREEGKGQRSSLKITTTKKGRSLFIDSHLNGNCRLMSRWSGMLLGNHRGIQEREARKNMVLDRCTTEPLNRAAVSSVVHITDRDHHTCRYPVRASSSV